MLKTDNERSMKPLYLLIGFLLGGLAVLGVSLLVSRDAQREVARADLLSADSGSNATDPRVDELVNRLEALQEQIEDLQYELSNMGDGVRSSVPQAVPVAAATLDGEHDALWYLEQYVASFHGGGEGAEYFRLAVDAFLPSLLFPVRDLVANPTANPILRRKLIEMLGTERFHENPTVLKLLLDQLGTTRDERLLLSILKALEVVATDQILPQLENVVWDIESQRAQQLCLKLITRLAGERINESILALITRAPDEIARALLISLISQVDLAKALEIFRFTSHSDPVTRMYAAHRVGQFVREDFIVFVGEWISYEPDEKIREVLGQAQKEQSKIPSWHPMQMTGPPDVSDPSRDSPAAWASMAADGGSEWAELTFDPPFRANLVRIHEVCTAGAVAEVHAIESSGQQHFLWSGADPTVSPGLFEIGFATTPYAVRRLRIVLDTSRVKGWSEIDAVELVGPGQRAWASSARASTYYGARALK